MPSFIPSPYAVVHVARTISGTVDPDTNNPVIADAAPVVRRAQSIAQIGTVRGSSRQIFSGEFLDRTVTDLHIAVDDPATYSADDQVVLFPTLDGGGDWVTGTGTAYFVDGVPMDASTSPWPSWSRGFGGLVRLRRAT